MCIIRSETCFKMLSRVDFDFISDFTENQERTAAFLISKKVRKKERRKSNHSHGMKENVRIRGPCWFFSSSSHLWLFRGFPSSKSALKKQQAIAGIVPVSMETNLARGQAVGILEGGKKLQEMT